MRRHLLPLAAVGILAAASALVSGSQPVSPRMPSSPRTAEVARLRAHFDSVDRELRGSNGRAWTPDRQASRAMLIGWLREYRNGGVFPSNDRFPQAMPFFRDRHGVLCAMAYLIERSGRGDLVDRVAATRNNELIAELARDPALGFWLDSVGLTVAEAGRIQPSYEPPEPPADTTVTRDYALTSVVVSGASAATLGLNLIAPSRGSAWAGVAAGSVGVIAGLANLDGGSGTDRVSAANIVIGGGALAAGLYRLIEARHGELVEGRSPRHADVKGDAAVEPLVAPAGEGVRMGLVLHRVF